MISKIRLTNYKGFDDFTAHLRESSFLVGPNNAGKSTLIGALRLVAGILTVARRRRPDVVRFDEARERQVWVYTLTENLRAIVGNNVSYEMREHLESRLVVTFKNKASVYVVWPSDGEAPFAYLEQIEGAQPINTRVVSDWFSTIGVVQTLAPVEQREQMLSEGHVQSNLGSRLASRHFRNQLYYLELNEPGDYALLKEFLIANTPEILDIELLSLAGEGDPTISLMFTETVSRSDKEVCWAGDGLQVWLQLLFHIWRHFKFATIILDEPDVYLHPDLQRRLVHILEDLSAQVVLATHAPELLAEASRETVVLIDRHRKRTRRINDDAVLSDLNSVLGSGFNLRLAKALRSKVALFVEGQDMRILKNLARVIGAKGVVQDRGLTVVPMGGASNRNMASSFGWLNEHLLDGAVKVNMLLDRDYMSEAASRKIVEDFESAGVHAHVWERKELESYLLSPSTVARISGAPVAVAEELLSNAVKELKATVRSRYLAARVEEERRAGENMVTVYDRLIPEFEDRWEGDGEWRSISAPAKQVLAGLNRDLQGLGWKAVSAVSLSNRIRAVEIPQEMKDTLESIENQLL